MRIIMTKKKKIACLTFMLFMRFILFMLFMPMTKKKIACLTFYAFYANDWEKENRLFDFLCYLCFLCFLCL